VLPAPLLTELPELLVLALSYQWPPTVLLLPPAAPTTLEQ
jgi:hypothetical protein